jgi:hypothetical protein
MALTIHLGLHVLPLLSRQTRCKGLMIGSARGLVELLAARSPEVSHLLGHIPRSVRRQQTIPAAAGLQVAHAAELVPAGAEQRRHLPPLGHSFSGVVPMF